MMVPEFKRGDDKRLGMTRMESVVVRELRIFLFHHKATPKQVDTTLDPPVFPPQTNNFQKPVKFVRALGNVVWEKKGEQPQPKPKPRPIRFHCEYYGRDGHKKKFCFKRKRKGRMDKECVNKEKYHPYHGVPEPRMPLPRCVAVVRSVPAWRDMSSDSRGGFLERTVRPALP
jgi:hypothetical protein